MNPLNLKKLLHSKWTAVAPVNKEKHFMIVRVDYADSGAVELAVLEAVHSGRTLEIAWQVLKDPARWRQGWT